MLNSFSKSQTHTLIHTEASIKNEFHRILQIAMLNENKYDLCDENENLEIIFTPHTMLHTPLPHTVKRIHKTQERQ